MERKENDPAALVARGMARRFKNDFVIALADLDAAITVRPSDPVALRERGVVLRNLGRLEESIASHDKSLAVAPNDPVTMNARGFAQITMGDPVAAVPDYCKALEVEPDYLQALVNRGEARLVLGKTEEAIEDLTRVVTLTDDAFSIASLGRGRLRVGDAKAAVAEFDKAIRLAPHDRELYITRALACFHAGEFDACMVDAELLQTMFPSDRVIMNLYYSARWAKVGFREPTDDEISAASARIANATLLQQLRENQFADRAVLLPQSGLLRNALANRRMSEIASEMEAKASAQADLSILVSLCKEMQARKTAADEFPADTEVGEAARRLLLTGVRLKHEGGPNTDVVAADLSFCHIRDEEVALLRQFPSLRSISLAGTFSTDAGLRPLAGLRELREIDLNQTAVSNAAAFWLGNTPLLERANFSNTAMAGPALAMLLRAPKLKHLDLAGTNLPSTDLEQLRRKSDWRSLSLDGLSVDDSLVEAIVTSSPDLESLNLSGTKVTDATMKVLGTLAHLRQLRLANTAITDAGLRELSPNNKWDWLDLTKTEVSDESCAVLADMKDLRILGLVGTRVTINGLRKLSGLRNLESLTVPNDVLTLRRDELRQQFPKVYRLP